MFKGCIYFKGSLIRNEIGDYVNFLMFEVEDLADIDTILENNNLGIEDINIIDFRE